MKNIKRYLIIGVFLGILVLPNVSSADVVADLQAQINALLAQVQKLQAQLAQMQGQPAAWCHDFNTNLKIGDRGDEIKALQYALAKEGFDIYDTDEEQASYFGELTASLVSAFQEKYKSEILTPLGLQYGTGYVGKATRAKLNSLYGCGVTPMPTPTPSPSPSCNNLWWFNNTTQICQQKTFCGAYMYYGLRTFSTLQECQTALLPTPTPTSTPSIIVLSPNGGEVWEIGKTYEIKWNSSLPTDTSIQIFLLKFKEKLTVGEVWSEALIAEITNLGSYSWTIPSSLSYQDTIMELGKDSEFKIRVMITGSMPKEGKYDDSDTSFSIVAAGMGQSFTLNQMASVLESMKTLLNQLFQVLKNL